MKPALKLLAASLAAEGVRKAVLHPLDTLTARLQYDAHRISKASPLANDARFIVKILTNEPASLYSGVGIALAGAVPQALVYMPTYTLCRSAGLPNQLASVVTGAASSCVRVPATLIKARVQLKLSTSASAAWSSATKLRGWRGLYDGWSATLALDVAYALVQFSALEFFVSAALAITGAAELPAGWDALVGLCTGAATAVATEPLDVVRLRLMANRAFGYRNLLDGLERVRVEEGLTGLFRGVLPRLLQKGLGSALWYFVFVRVRAALI